jgi:hypothetical protein
MPSRSSDTLPATLCAVVQHQVHILPLPNIAITGPSVIRTGVAFGPQISCITCVDQLSIVNSLSVCRFGGASHTPQGSADEPA